MRSGAAEILGVSGTRVNTLVGSKELRAFYLRAGTRTFRVFKRRDVERLREKRARGAK